MSYIYNNNPTLGQKGFIVGNRFISSQSGDVTPKGLVLGINPSKDKEKDYVGDSLFLMEECIFKRNYIEFDGINDYLICNYDYSLLLDTFSMVIKFKAYSNGVVLGTTQTCLPSSNEEPETFIPNIVISNNKFRCMLWSSDLNADNIVGYTKNEEIKNQTNIIMLLSDSNKITYYMNNELLFEKNNVDVDVSRWSRQISLGCGYDGGEDVRLTSKGWNYCNCEVYYFYLYNRVLSLNEINRFR